MSKRGAWFAAIAFSLAVLILLGAKREPRHEGIPLNRWLADYDGPSIYLRQRSNVAMREMGSRALPGIIQSLKAEDSRITRALIDFYNSAAKSNVRYVSARERRLRAMMACRALEQAAEPALPALIDCLADPLLRYDATVTLQIVDPEIFPLYAVVTNQNRSMQLRVAAATRLGSGNYNQPMVKTVLEQAQQDENRSLRKAAREALHKLSSVQRPGGNVL